MQFISAFIIIQAIANAYQDPSWIFDRTKTGSRTLSHSSTVLKSFNQCTEELEKRPRRDGFLVHLFPEDTVKFFWNAVFRQNNLDCFLTVSRTPKPYLTEELISYPERTNLGPKKHQNYHQTRVIKAQRKLYEFVSGEIQINDNLTDNQVNPFVFALTDEKLVIIWVDYFNLPKLIVQQVDPNLNVIGSQTTLDIGDFGVKTDSKPCATYLSDENYVVAWETADEDIYAQIFNNVNQPVGDTIKISDIWRTPNKQLSISTLTDGSFVITWTSVDDRDFIMFRRFDSSGAPIEDEIEAFSNIDGAGDSKIAALKDGRFVITWRSNTEDDMHDIFYQIFNSTGIPTNESPFTANTYTTEDQLYPVVACLNNGRFVIAYSSNKLGTLETEGEDYDQGGVYAQLFESSGTKLGNEFLVNTYKVGNQQPEDITALYDGGFIVTWISDNQDGDAYGVYAQRFDKDANPVGIEFIINDTTDDSQKFSNIGKLVNGFVVVWQSKNQDGYDYGIYAKTYQDEPLTIDVNYPLADASIYSFQSFSYVIPVNTFSPVSSSSEPLTYSFAMKIGGVDMGSSAWLSFDPTTRTFTGSPAQDGVYQVEVNVLQGTATGMDEFIINVFPNMKPILNSRIPDQLVPFSSDIIWEYYIPDNTFSDPEGDHITYTNAYMILNGEERSLNVLWESLSFSNNKLYGIPNLSGDYVVRLYADDGLGELNSTPTDININVFSQGLEILQLFNIDQAGSKGLISKNGDHFWIANKGSLKRFNLDSDDPLFVLETETEYLFPDEISDLEEVSEGEILAVDQSGNIKLLTSSSNQEHMDLTLDESISDIYKQDKDSFFVSYGHSISYITRIEGGLQLENTISIDSIINKITKINDMIYAATENGIYQINSSLTSYSKIDMLHTRYIYDITSNDTSLLVLDGDNLIIIDAEDPDSLWLIIEKALLGTGTSFYIFEKEENTICMTVEEGSGVGILNLSNPELSAYQGYYYPTEVVNQALVDGTGSWGIVLEEFRVYTIEVFRKENLIERCDTGSESEPCNDTKNVQASQSFSKGLYMFELYPNYYQGYFYGYFYVFSATWFSEGSYAPLPNWIEGTQETLDEFTVTGTIPDSLIGSVVHIEVAVDVYDTDAEHVITLKKLVSLSVVHRESSLAVAIPDQSLQVGDEWLFSFPKETFNDATEFECEYQINSEWIKSYDISFILFFPEQRQWYISSSDSTKETLFQCDPCDSSEYSATYLIKVTARNKESEHDPGVSTTFKLFLYSGRIPDQEIHPGLSQSIILDEDIFPIEATYTVSLLNDDGETETLPWWMSFISNERKILMFPSENEIGQDFNIQVNGLETDTELVSYFTIKVRNEAPIVLEELPRQRIKLGNLLDYSVPESAFADPDSDDLTYTAKRLMEDGSETSALPSWVNFNPSTRTFYGTPLSESTLSLLVYADDGLGGTVNQILILECYNNIPQRNPAIPLDNQSIHIGDLFTFSLNSDLFLDADKDILSYSVTQTDWPSLPSWLSFNANSLTISGTPSDPGLLENSVSILVTVSDGYTIASTSFTLSITNIAPAVSFAISDQLSNDINQEFVKLKPGVRIEFLLSIMTFKDGDNDILSYSARLSDGNPLPEWLVFDSNTQMFYGTPLEVQNLSISVTAFDGYASVTSNFNLNIQNKLPTVGVSLQSQLDSLYSGYLKDGSPFEFSISSSTFQDEDDKVLDFSVLFKEEDGEWRSLDDLWISFDGITFTGTVTSNSINNSTITIQVTASDGFESVTDQFNINLLSLFPSTSQNVIYVESQRSSIEIEVFTNGPKLSVFNHGSVSSLDLSNDQKTYWKLEGSPADINYILERVHYRETSSRRLVENTVSLKISNFEQEYPISVFLLQQPIISNSIPDQKSYIENSFNLNVKKYFNYLDQDLLTYTFSLKKKPGGSKDWLSFDSRTISGIPIDSTDIGDYIIEITVKDEFEESSSESFVLKVDYTFFQFIVIYFFTILELGGPLLTLLGIFALRTNISNSFFKASKIYAPLEIGTNEPSIRRILVLRKDEEKVANKIFQKLPKNYEIDDESLVYDLDRILFEGKSTQTVYKSVIYPEIYNTHQYKSQNTTFKICLNRENSSIIEINKHKYHAKYLYLCIKDLIYKSALDKHQKKELEMLVTEFKKYMLNNYYQRMIMIHGEIPIKEWAKIRDAWTVMMPNIDDLSVFEFQDLRIFLDMNKTNIKHEIILNSLKIEQWKDKAIRLDNLSDLKKIRISYENDFYCKMKTKKDIMEWVYHKWLVLTLTDDELKIEFDDIERSQKEDIYVQTFDETGYLLSEVLLVSSRRSIGLAPLNESILRNRIDSNIKDKIDIAEGFNQ